MQKRVLRRKTQYPFSFRSFYTKGLTEQKFRKTRRKGGWAPTAYIQYVEVDALPTTKYCGIYACEGAIPNILLYALKNVVYSEKPHSSATSVGR